MTTETAEASDDSECGEDTVAEANQEADAAAISSSADDDAGGGGEDDDGDLATDADGAVREEDARQWRRMPPCRLAVVAGIVMVLVAGALLGWLSYQWHRSLQAAEQRTVYVQAARQAAVNLTTIDWEHADADVQRVLDSATGTFRDDFAKRSRPFVDVVEQVKSKSEGTVNLAGLESVTGDQARVLIAMSVKTTTSVAPEASPRAWRMRIDVQKVGKDVKVSNVEFVP
jgi:Mce-associated membrane protein